MQRNVFTAVVAAAALIGLAVASSVIACGNDESQAQVVRDYNLQIVPEDIDYGNSNIWHAWTFKLAGQSHGTVPGPTLVVNVGEKLRVHVKNNLDLVHSFHTHLSDYDQEVDGSQTNIISGKGTGAMIPPGGEFTYEFEPKEPGIYYYHCHSADGGLMITQHIHQGLYGAIIVKDPDEPDVRDEVIFMAEIGHETEGQVPPFIMNGLGLPGGEHALEQVYLEGGFDAVAAQLNKTVPAIHTRVGEELRVHLINIGDQVHTFHAHNVDHISQQMLPGQLWPANVVSLLPGAADTVSLTFTKPGLWLFHCHVVNHADAGMIGLFIVEDDEPLVIEPTGGPRPSPEPTPTRSPPTGTPPGGTPTQGAVQASLREWAIELDGADELTVPAGDVALEVHNAGATFHELAVIKTDLDPANLPTDGAFVDEAAAGQVIDRTNQLNAGATELLELELEPGNYALICNIAGHYQQGMRARLQVE